MGQFSAGPINKAAPSFRDNLTEYVKGDGIHSEHFSVLREIVHTYSVCAVLNH